MFSSFSGSKAHYAGFTLLVVSEFNEWRVLAYAPETILHGTRQFTESKAREHAQFLVESYQREQGHEEGALPEPVWEPTGKQDWVVWRG